MYPIAASMKTLADYRGKIKRLLGWCDARRGVTLGLSGPEVLSLFPLLCRFSKPTGRSRRLERRGKIGTSRKRPWRCVPVGFPLLRTQCQQTEPLHHTLGICRSWFSPRWEIPPPHCIKCYQVLSRDIQSARIFEWLRRNKVLNPSQSGTTNFYISPVFIVTRIESRLSFGWSLLSS